ncbi:TetR/AcrR family transcriptional regulator [Streptomyces longispororuber]|uniref:TetR/AcrR family transcriptional regulator n=1 Tax=Streptomyces longispororuber TaxID=68230 RepID=UPI001E3AFBD7|nr:TetR/AcrR family transcriptional regulator [Streptomyces longispororuber]
MGPDEVPEPVPEEPRRPARAYGGKPAEQRRAERRRRFLEAGVELFGAGPGAYRTASVAALCARAGLSTRQFYEEFRNLEDVLAALHRQVQQAAQTAVVEALAEVAGGTVRERVETAFRAYARVLTAHPHLVRIAFVEVTGVTPELERRRLEARRGWVDLLVAALDEAAERGEIGARDYRLAALGFVGAVNGLLYDWTAGYVDASLDTIVDELMLLFMGLLRPPPPPGPGAPG